MFIGKVMQNRGPKPGIQVVSFDVMNTILTLREPPEVVYTRFAQKYGFSVDVTQVKERFPKGFSEISQKFPSFGYKTIGPVEWWGKVIRRSLFGNEASTSTDRVDDLCKTLFAHYEDAEQWKIVDEDIHKVLTSFRSKGIHTAVISNFDFRLKKLLDDFQLSDLFEMIVLSGEVGKEKPDPQVFKLVTSHFDLASPKHLLHIGDHLKKDLEGAKNFGAQAILFDPENRHSNGGISESEKITKISEILNWLK